MSLDLKPEEIEQLQAALRRFIDEELDAEDFEGLPIRVRVALFICIMADNTSPDWVWQGSFAAAVRRVFPNVRTSTINNLNSECEGWGLREWRAFKSHRYVVFFPTRQLCEFLGYKYNGEGEKEGPYEALRILDALQSLSLEAAQIAAALLSKHGSVLMSEVASGLSTAPNSERE